MNFTSKYAAKHKGGNFISQVIKDRAVACVLYCPGNESIGEAWYVVDVDSGKEKEFKQRLETGETINFTEYGTIIYSGWGKEPPESLKVKLSEKYGLYEN